MAENNCNIDFYTGATFSECKKYRYLLWRKWSIDKPFVLFICLNPSIADSSTNDPTTLRLIKFAKKWGYGGFYLVNLFAYRATEPKDLIEACKRGIDIIGPDNNQTIIDTSLLCDKVVFAWGVIEWSTRDKDVENMFKEAYYIGFSKKGFPRHPLFLNGNLIPKLYKKHST